MSANSMERAIELDLIIDLKVFSLNVLVMKGLVLFFVDLSVLVLVVP